MSRLVLPGLAPSTAAITLAAAMPAAPAALLIHRPALEAGADALLRRMALAQVPVVVFGAGPAVPGAAVRDGDPTARSLLLAARELGFDLARSWLVATSVCWRAGLGSAGGAGLVVIGQGADDDGIPPLRHVERLAECTRAMVPPGGGCWHAPA